MINSVIHSRLGLMSPKNLEIWQEALQKFFNKLQDCLRFNNDNEFFGSVSSTNNYQEDYKNRWDHWLRKLMQLGICEDILDAIPREDYPQQKQK